MDRPVKGLPPPTLSLQDAKARFSEVVAAAMRGRAQHVTRRGKPAVVIVAADEFEKLSRASRPKAQGFIDYLRSMPLPPKGVADIDLDPRRRPKITPRDSDFGA